MSYTLTHATSVARPAKKVFHEFTVEFTVGEEREIYAGMRIFGPAKQTKSPRS